MSLVLPVADLSGPDDAIKFYLDAGLRPILIYAPKDKHECWCGKTHDAPSEDNSSSGKHPIARNWQKSQTFEDLANQLARLKFTPNIGIVLGEQWNGEYLIAIDVDNVERMVVLQSELGELPDTVRGESGRGYRLLFELGDEVSKSDLRNVTGLCGEPGVDVKIKGGQVVVAPSVHLSGRKYTWTKLGEIARLPAAWALALKPKSYEVPDWAKKYTPHTMREDKRAKLRAEKYLESAVLQDANLIASTKQGSRNTLLHKRAVALLALCAGLHLSGQWSWVQQELARAAESAGLPRAEVARTIASAEKYVRESGAVRMPVSTGSPRSEAPPPPPPDPSAESTPSSPPPAPEEPVTEEMTIKHTDLANAESLIEWHGGMLRFVGGGWDKWLVWGGDRWKLDDLGGAIECAKKTARRLASEANTARKAAYKRKQEALREEDDLKLDKANSDLKRSDLDIDHAKKSQAKDKLLSMLFVARSDPKLAVHHEYLDADRFTINVRNGTIDLRTGDLRPHQQWDLLTKVSGAPYDPDAKCPTWLAFLDRVTGGNSDLVEFLQRAVGYSLTGSVQEHALFFCYGRGANGKSTFLSTIHALMGEYAAPAARGLLFRSRNERHPTSLATLHGRRFVTCSEIEDGQAFDEALIKDLTGGDPINARRMNENEWFFLPTHKLWLAGNHRPHVRGDDEGIWRRMRMLPFTVTIPERERDPELTTKLRGELPGILVWSIEGAKRWCQFGLTASDTVRHATSQYRQENDIVGQFFRERIQPEDGAVVGRAELRAVYELWSKEIGAEPVGPRRLASRLRDHLADAGVTLGETTKRVADHVVNAWRGLKFRQLT